MIMVMVNIVEVIEWIRISRYGQAGGQIDGQDEINISQQLTTPSPKPLCCVGDNDDKLWSRYAPLGLNELTEPIWAPNQYREEK